MRSRRTNTQAARDVESQQHAENESPHPCGDCGDVDKDEPTHSREQGENARHHKTGHAEEQGARPYATVFAAVPAAEHKAAHRKLHYEAHQAEHGKRPCRVLEDLRTSAANCEEKDYGQRNRQHPCCDIRFDLPFHDRHPLQLLSALGAELGARGNLGPACRAGAHERRATLHAELARRGLLATDWAYRHAQRHRGRNFLAAHGAELGPLGEGGAARGTRRGLGRRGRLPLRAHACRRRLTKSHSTCSLRVCRLATAAASLRPWQTDPRPNQEGRS